MAKLFLTMPKPNKQKRVIKAWAVLKNGKLQECKKSEWVLPIMFDRTIAFGYSLLNKSEEVVPIEIHILK